MIEKAIEYLEWAIANKKTLSETTKNFGVNEKYFRDVRSRGSNKLKYKTFIELYNKAKQRSKVEVALQEVSTDLDDEQRKFTEEGNLASYEYKGSKMLTSLEEAIDFFKIDTLLWEVERYVCNSYPVSARRREQDLTWSKTPEGAQIMQGYSKRLDEWTTTVNYQVKVWLKKRVQVEQAINASELFRELIESNKSSVKHTKVIYKPKKEKNLLEINIFDLHLGKLCWAEEVGNNYDIKIATKRFNYALETLLQRASSYDVERILFPVGNDFFNSDNHLNTTTLGTRQDEDVRWQKSFKIGHKLLTDGIDKMRQIAPVDVVVIPGNHDGTKSFYLGEVLSAFYKDDTCVTVDNRSASRKYYEYGKVLLGLTHGDKERHEALRSLMAGEAREAWARTVYREWHVGHQHRKLSKSHVVKSDLLHEELFVTIRSMSSLAGTDVWHFQNGYLGPTRAAEAFIWNKESGMVGNLNVNIKLNDDI